MIDNQINSKPYVYNTISGWNKCRAKSTTSTIQKGFRVIIICL